MSVSVNSAAIFSPPAQNRALGLCVTASIALHALALLLPGLRAGAPSPAAARVLTATLAPRMAADTSQTPVRESRARPDPVPAPPKSDPVPPKPEPARPKPARVGPMPGPARPKATPLQPMSDPPRPKSVPVRPISKPAPPKPDPVSPVPDLTRPKREPVPRRLDARPKPENPRPEIAMAIPLSPVPGAAQGPATRAATPIAPFAAAPSGSKEGAAVTGVAGSPPAGPAAGARTARSVSEADPGTLQRYRLALIVSARRYRRYPALAMDKGWQGRVEVRLVVGANGGIRSSLIKSSSGHAVLDRQALDMVEKAKPLTPIPAALRGREFTVDIPVIFDLRAG